MFYFHLHLPPSACMWRCMAHERGGMKAVGVKKGRRRSVSFLSAASDGSPLGSPASIFLQWGPLSFMIRGVGEGGGDRRDADKDII